MLDRNDDIAAVAAGPWVESTSVQSLLCTDGPSAGTRVLRVIAGPLDVDLLPDRGLDIGAVRFRGESVGWLSPTGFPVPQAGDEQGWARSFGGGLLTTCGLMNFGPACVVDGETHPMHGRYTQASARIVRADDQGGVVTVEAIVTESSVLGVHWENRRTIRMSTAGVIDVSDVITNRSARPAAPMVLYHLNLGGAFVTEGATVRATSIAVEPRDEAAAAGLDHWDRFPATAPTYPEQVFRHVLAPEATDAEVAVMGAAAREVTVTFDPAVMPGLFQWRVAEPGCVVLGIEPATAPTILGRADAARRGLLRDLAPGERLSLGVTVRIGG